MRARAWVLAMAMALAASSHHVTSLQPNVPSAPYSNHLFNDYSSVALPVSAADEPNVMEESDSLDPTNRHARFAGVGR